MDIKNLNKDMSVVEMLRAGFTAEDMLKELREQIAEAQREIDKEKSDRTEKLNKARRAAVVATIDYFELLVGDENLYSEEDIDQITKDIATNEKGLLTKLTAASKMNKSMDDALNILKTFAAR